MSKNSSLKSIKIFFESFPLNKFNTAVSIIDYRSSFYPNYVNFIRENFSSSDS